MTTFLRYVMELCWLVSCILTGIEYPFSLVSRFIKYLNKKLYNFRLNIGYRIDNEFLIKLGERS